MKEYCDVLIIGGGLAGMLSVIGLSTTYSANQLMLIDQPLEGNIGGFAKFSGAKFSLLPAGSGLLPITENEDTLRKKIDEAIKILGINTPNLEKSETLGVQGKIEHRAYESYVLTPTEIDSLIERLSNEVYKKCTSFNDEILTIDDSTGVIIATTKNGRHIECKVLIYAGGRSSSDLLDNAGLEKTNIKGIDLGFRVEFNSSAPLDKIRKIGPDSKFIYGNSRTFCLNNPGEIYWYNAFGIEIPGGIVANKGVNRANLGILTRRADKHGHIEKLKRNLNSLQQNKSLTIQKNNIEEYHYVFEEIYGKNVADELIQFYRVLECEKIIDWNHEHIIHLPLIDWHWDTYSIEKSFRTSKDNIFCIGDASGHARGLLQAAVSGLIVSDEIVKNYV